MAKPITYSAVSFSLWLISLALPVFHEPSMVIYGYEVLLGGFAALLPPFVFFAILQLPAWFTNFIFLLQLFRYQFTKEGRKTASVITIIVIISIAIITVISFGTTEERDPHFLPEHGKTIYGKTLYGVFLLPGFYVWISSYFVLLLGVYKNGQTGKYNNT